jgi:hypothetical protein
MKRKKKAPATHPSAAEFFFYNLFVHYEIKESREMKQKSKCKLSRMKNLGAINRM